MTTMVCACTSTFGAYVDHQQHQRHRMLSTHVREGGSDGRDAATGVGMVGNKGAAAPAVCMSAPSSEM
jgi:hypothetical protein